MGGQSQGLDEEERQDKMEKFHLIGKTFIVVSSTDDTIGVMTL